MAKNDIKEDIFSGESISNEKKSKTNKVASDSASNAEKAAKKAEKQAKKEESNKKKAEEKIKALKEDVATLTDSLQKEEDDKKKLSIQKKIDGKVAKIAELEKYGKIKFTLSANQKTAIKSTVAIVVVLALLVTYVSTGLVRKGFVNSCLQWTTAITGVTVENSETGEKMSVPVSTYNYYFAVTYNNLQSTQQQYEQYGLDLSQYNLDVDFDKKLSEQTTTNSDDKVVTWAEYVEDQCVDSIEQTYTYYMAAVAANDGKEPEITDDQKSDLEDNLSQYKETANGYGYTLSGYLVRAMGKGVTEKVFRRESIRSYIAQNYQEELSSDTTSTEYTDEDYNTYKDENLADLQSVNVRVFECDSEDDAKAFKSALKSNASNFTSLCEKYSADGFYKDYYSDDSASTLMYAKKSLFTNGGYAIATADDDKKTPGLDWLFSEDRKSGDVKQYSTTVVYVIDPVSLADVNTVNVRHIIISPITDSNDDTKPVDATDEQWETAYKNAEDILKEWKSGDKTEDSFAALATDNSSDTGSAENGGLYENICPGDMVATFNNWSFDSSRKAGDTAIIKSNYGYHIMYFSGENKDMPAWKYTAKTALASDTNSSLTKKLEDNYTSKVSWFGSRYFEKDIDIDM